jgi:hypothetical protein
MRGLHLVSAQSEVLLRNHMSLERGETSPTVPLSGDAGAKAFASGGDRIAWRLSHKPSARPLNPF